MTATPSWMIYGANGYTGALIAREARKRGLRPILAGRNPEVATLADELGLESRVFGLGSNTPLVTEHLKGVNAVLHCAGPFSATSQPMLEACMQARAHYLDITGEITVFEGVFARDAELKAAQIAALPGAGFDVVPTDCLAALLKHAMPDATHLTLAFRSSGKLSPGTAKSMIEGLALGGKVRVNGQITAVPIAARTREIVFKNRPEHAILSPWGDISTAYHSTGIPNIEFYIAGRPGSEHFMRWGARLTRSRLFRSLAKKVADRFVQGDDEKARLTHRCRIWGEAMNAAGANVQKRLELPQSYEFTVTSALACVERVVSGQLAPGAWTPSKAFGREFVLSLAGVNEISI